MDGTELNTHAEHNLRIEEEKNATYAPTAEEILAALSDTRNEVLLHNLAAEMAHGVDPKVEVVGSTWKITAEFFDASQNILVLKTSTGEKVSINLRAKHAKVYTAGASVETPLYIDGKKAACTIRNDGGTLRVKLNFANTETTTKLGYVERVVGITSAGLKIDGISVKSYTEKVYGKPDDPSFDKNIPSNWKLTFVQKDGLFYLIGEDDGRAWFDKQLVMINPSDMKLNQWKTVTDLKFDLPLQVRLQLDQSGVLALHVWPSQALIEKYFSTTPEKKTVTPPVTPKPTTPPQDNKPADNKNTEKKSTEEKTTTPKSQPKNDTSDEPTIENDKLKELMSEKKSMSDGGRIDYAGKKGSLFYKRVRGIPDDRQEDVQVEYHNGEFSIWVQYVPGARTKIGSYTLQELAAGNLDHWYGKKNKIGGIVTAKREGEALRIHRGVVKSKDKLIGVENNYMNRVYPFSTDIPGLLITGHFGEDRDNHSHEGVDISMPSGNNIHSVDDGIVVESRYDPNGYGYYVTVEHANGIKTRYAHLGYKAVNINQRVVAGSIVGYSGSSGHTTGPTGEHLHFEVHKNNKIVNPAQYIDFTRRDKNNELKGVRPKVEHSSVGPIQSGVASFYNEPGKKTASGELYNARALTAAHPNLPFGTKVKVSRVDDPDQFVIVRINDRGPFVEDRIIDLSVAAAEQVGLAENGRSTDGVTNVKVEVIQ